MKTHLVTDSCLSTRRNRRHIQSMRDNIIEMPIYLIMHSLSNLANDMLLITYRLLYVYTTLMLY